MRLWPAVLRLKHSSKISDQTLIDRLIEKTSDNLETFDIITKVIYLYIFQIYLQNTHTNSYIYIRHTDNHTTSTHMPHTQLLTLSPLHPHTHTPYTHTPPTYIPDMVVETAGHLFTTSTHTTQCPHTTITPYTRPYTSYIYLHPLQLSTPAYTDLRQCI